MPDLGKVWRSRFGREIEDGGVSPGYQSGRKVMRFSMNVPGGARCIELDDGYDEALRELGLVDLCQECREKLRGGAGVRDLDARCSDLMVRGMSEGG